MRTEHMIRSGRLSASTVRTLNALPAHLQKDIGWPEQHHRQPLLARIAANLLGSAD